MEFAKSLIYGSVRPAKSLNPMQHLIDAHRCYLSRKGDYRRTGVAFACDICFGLSTGVLVRVRSPQCFVSGSFAINHATACKTWLRRDNYRYATVKAFDFRRFFFRYIDGKTEINNRRQ
jgi:hypothetical protein